MAIRKVLLLRERPAYSPTAEAAFSLNMSPSRIYRLNTVMLLCPVV
jgi:hypothetical protein